MDTAPSQGESTQDRPANGGRIPRILLVSGLYPSERDPVFGSFVARQVDALTALGAPVEVVANTDPRTGALRAAMKYARLGSRARAAGKRGAGALDVVVGHFLYPTAVAARSAARAAGVPFALVAHGTDVASVSGDSRVARECRAAMAEACLIIAVSEDLAARVRATGVKTPLAVCHMGVDTRRFRPVPSARRGLHLDVIERIALFAGNLVRVKNVESLITAFASLHAQGECDRLVIVGDGPLRPDLEAAAVDKGVGDSVAFTGKLPNEELPAWMNAADVFVLPSRNEGLGLVALEAMACGTPVVATAVGGIPEIVTDESIGQLVEPDDPEALARGMRTVLAAGRGRYEEACRAKATENDVATMASRFLDLIGQAGCVR